MVVVKLGEAGRHLARPGSRGGDDDEVVTRLHIVVASQALIGDDACNIIRVSRDREVAVDADPEALETAFDGFRFAIVVGSLGDDD